jgi:hypothetical protein
MDEGVITVKKTKFVVMIINILLSVAFASTFIAIFFFTYAKNVEKQIVLKNVKYFINDINYNFISILPDNIKKSLSDKLSQVELPDMSEEDNATAESNRKLLIKSMMIFSVFFIILFSSAFGLAHFTKNNFFEILLENVFLLCGVATIEFLFLTFIASNFISVDTNNIKYSVFKTIDNAVKHNSKETN